MPARGDLQDRSRRCPRAPRARERSLPSISPREKSDEAVTAERPRSRRAGADAAGIGRHRRQGRLVGFFEAARSRSRPRDLLVEPSAAFGRIPDALGASLSEAIVALGRRRRGAHARSSRATSASRMRARTQASRPGPRRRPARPRPSDRPAPPGARGVPVDLRRRSGGRRAGGTEPDAHRPAEAPAGRLAGLGAPRPQAAPGRPLASAGAAVQSPSRSRSQSTGSPGPDRAGPASIKLGAATAGPHRQKNRQIRDLRADRRRRLRRRLQGEGPVHQAHRRDQDLPVERRRDQEPILPRGRARRQSAPPQHHDDLRLRRRERHSLHRPGVSDRRRPRQGDQARRCRSRSPASSRS